MKTSKHTQIKCGISKETDKAIEIAISNSDGLYFIWLPKSQVTIISKNDKEDSYGFAKCFAATISIADWLFKNFDEKGIRQVKDDCGDWINTRLRYRLA